MARYRKLLLAIIDLASSDSPSPTAKIYWITKYAISGIVYRVWGEQVVGSLQVLALTLKRHYKLDRECWATLGEALDDVQTRIEKRRLRITKTLVDLSSLEESVKKIKDLEVESKNNS